MTDLPEYIFNREFDASPDLVWRAWTDPDLLHRWYGPGIETIIHEYDLRPGGRWLNEMKWGGNSDLSRMDFQDVVAGEKLVWLHASTDKDWKVISNPMMPDWPKLLLTTVTFAANGAGTKLRLHQVPVDPSEAEITCFANMMSGMSGGWGKGMDMLEGILAEL